jgi:protein arginine kinase
MNADLINAIVVTSRVRLARNLREFKFPHRMEEGERLHAVDKIVDAARPLNLAALYAQQMQPAYRQWLVEEHLVSRDWARAGHGALLLSKERDAAIMLMEEDHLRMQCLIDGLALNEAHRRAGAQHEALEGALDFAYTPSLGYLTACPSNVGTGLRASALMHLAALVVTGRAKATFDELKGKGIEVRGLYGEGSAATGHLFQISNRVSLGCEDDALVARMTQNILQIANAEAAARHTLLASHRVDVEDRVSRAFGILRYAKKLARDEAMMHLSDVMLGQSLGLLPGVEANVPRLIRQVQPGHLQYDHDNTLPQDQQRAALCAAAMQPLA